MPRVLAVDDSPEALLVLVEALRIAGYDVWEASTFQGAERLLHDRAWDLVVSDVHLDAGRTGLELLAMRKSLPDPPHFVLVTGAAEVDTAVMALRAGAFDFLPKPVSLTRLIEAARKAIAAKGAHPKGPSSSIPSADPSLLGHSPAMVEVFRAVARACSVDSPVLVRGEEGLGREQVAREIHHHSPRAQGPFVVLPCAALAGTPVDAPVLADAARRAHGGTLFLDRVNHLPVSAQASLARLVAKDPSKQGDPESPAADVRFISSVAEGIQDERPLEGELRFLLSVIEVRLPALRERPDDIPLLVEPILARIGTRVGRAVTLSPDALAALRERPWKGNLPELSQVLERAALESSTGEVGADDLAPLLAPHAAQREATERVDPAPVPFPDRRYLLHRLVVCTNMSEVWEATQTALGRKVIIKFLATSGVGQERFRREARIQATLRHPNIPAVFEAGTEEHEPHRMYIVLEHVEGDTLDVFAQGLIGSAPEQDRLCRLLRILSQVALALDYLHQQGLVHRDVKPQNVIVTPRERAFLIDYGLARPFDARDPLTRAGAIVGTPSFMAPEQVDGRGAALDGRVDIWGLGATAYLLLTHKFPFDSADSAEMARQVCGEEPEPPRAVNPELPPTVEQIVLRCLRKPRDERFARAADVAAAVDDVVRSLGG